MVVSGTKQCVSSDSLGLATVALLELVSTAMLPKLVPKMMAALPIFRADV